MALRPKWGKKWPKNGENIEKWPQIPFFHHFWAIFSPSKPLPSPPSPSLFPPPPLALLRGSRRGRAKRGWRGGGLQAALARPTRQEWPRQTNSACAPLRLGPLKGTELRWHPKDPAILKIVRRANSLRGESNRYGNSKTPRTVLTFSIFWPIFPIFGFRPVFHSIPGGLTRKTRSRLLSACPNESCELGQGQPPPLQP